MIIKKNNYTNLFIGSIFLFFFLTGLIIYDDYGIGWDEYYQRINGFVALNFVREIFSLEEIYSHLKHSTINFAETAKIYGVIFDLPAAYFETLFEIKDSKDFFLFRHLANFIVLIFIPSCLKTFKVFMTSSAFTKLNMVDFPFAIEEIIIDLCDIDLSPGISIFPLIPFCIFEFSTAN